MTVDTRIALVVLGALGVLGLLPAMRTRCHLQVAFQEESGMLRMRGAILEKTRANGSGPP
jgi:hypothetical protein